MRRVILVVAVLLLAGGEAEAKPLGFHVGWGFGMGVQRAEGAFARRYNTGLGPVMRSGISVRIGGWAVEGAALLGRGTASNGRFAAYDVGSFGIHARRYVTLFTRRLGTPQKEPRTARLELYGRLGREWALIPQVDLPERTPGWGYGLGLALRVTFGTWGRTGVTMSCWIEDGRLHARVPAEEGTISATFSTWTYGLGIGVGR